MFSSALLFIIIIVNRFRIIRKEKRDLAFTEKWRPILLENLYNLPKSVEPISPKYNIAFLLLWNNLQSILEGPANEQLNQLARSLKMDQVAHKLLSSRKRSRQLLGIITLGKLKQENTWERLMHFSKKDNIVLAVAALQAMAKTNPKKTLPHVLSFMKERDDWPNYKMVIILDEIGASVFSKPLANMLQILPLNKRVRLLSFMQFADAKTSLHLARELLHSQPDFEVIAEALNLISIFGDARDLNLVKNYLHHEKSFIRMKAVKALGEIGDQETLSCLEKSLSDPDWWVRYRTAQTIMKLPGMTTEALLAIRDRQTDRFSIDILNYVLS